MKILQHRDGHCKSLNISTETRVISQSYQGMDMKAFFKICCNAGFLRLCLYS